MQQSRWHRGDLHKSREPLTLAHQDLSYATLWIRHSKLQHHLFVNLTRHAGYDP
ncbi:hypothetical protein D3C87_1073280 [compost metagenome]